MGTVSDYFYFQNGYAFKSADFVPEGAYKIVKIKELKDGQVKFFDDTAEIDVPDDFDVDKYLIEKGDVLFALTGDPVNKPNPLSWVGRVSYYNHDEPALLNQRVCKAVPKGDIPGEFLYYFFRQENAFYSLAAKATGSASQANISTKTIEQHNMEVPSRETIEKIVGLMKNLDNKIMINSKINRNLSEQAFALFDQMYLSHDIKDTCDLAVLAEINPKRALSKNTEARCVDMSKLSTSGAFPDGWEYKQYTGGMKFINGDTLLARITPCLENGKTAYVNFLDENETAFGSTEYIVLSGKGSTPAELLYCLARYPKFVEYAVKNMNGSSGRQRVSGEIIGQYQIPHFSDLEMKSFGVIVKELFEKMKNNSFENMRLAEMRDSLLPKLMSGELDVSELDI